jgi:predicted transcriptional regulator
MERLRIRWCSQAVEMFTKRRKKQLAEIRKEEETGDSIKRKEVRRS